MKEILRLKEEMKQRLRPSEQWLMQCQTENRPSGDCEILMKSWQLRDHRFRGIDYAEKGPRKRKTERQRKKRR